MTDKELKRLSRLELLKLLLHACEENSELRKQVDSLNIEKQKLLRI